MKNWKNIKVGEIEQTKENSKVLKELLVPKKEEFNLDGFIKDIDVRIKRPRFE